MKTILYVAISALLLAGCSKKKSSGDLSEIPAAAFDLPIMIGRNVDSLKNMPYEPRILAFSIELGHRSADFNKRLDLIIGSVSPEKSWRDVVEERITTANYRSAESYNRSYLDSLAGVLKDPPAVFVSSEAELKAALGRLYHNYETLRRYDGFASLSAILDSVLINEQSINRALNNFKNVIESAQEQTQKR